MTIPALPILHLSLLIARQSKNKSILVDKVNLQNFGPIIINLRFNF